MAFRVKQLKQKKKNENAIKVDWKQWMLMMCIVLQLIIALWHGLSCLERILRLSFSLSVISHTCCSLHFYTQLRFGLMDYGQYTDIHARRQLSAYSFNWIRISSTMKAFPLFPFPRIDCMSIWHCYCSIMMSIVIVDWKSGLVWHSFILLFIFGSYYFFALFVFQY